MDDEAYPGCGYTLRQWLVWEGGWKYDNAATDKAWSDRIKMEAGKRKLNTDYDHSNDFHPHSLHLVQQILGIRDASMLEYHPCLECNMYAWEPLPHADWRVLEKDPNEEGDPRYFCPVCGSPRFKNSTDATNGKTCIVPQHVSASMCVCGVHTSGWVHAWLSSGWA